VLSCQQPAKTQHRIRTGNLLVSTMVRITLPNRLKSFNGGGTNSASHSRSTSPNPNGSMKKSSGGADGSPEKPSGLMLKVVVLKVCFSRRLGTDWGGTELIVISAGSQPRGEG
jgi:hypothetical protein